MLSNLVPADAVILKTQTLRITTGLKGSVGENTSFLWKTKELILESSKITVFLEFMRSLENWKSYS